MKKEFTLSFAFLLLFLIASVSACSCIQTTVDSSYTDSSNVFTGTVSNINPKSDNNEVTLSVINSYKGENKNQIKLITPKDSASCGFNFVEGETYLVYAYTDENNDIISNLCSRTSLLNDAQSDIPELEILRGIYSDCGNNLCEGSILCGNGICDEGEADTPLYRCGPNERCIDSEVKPGTCPQDCLDKEVSDEPVCGNGICEEGEDEILGCKQDTIPPTCIYNCSQDCFECPQITTIEYCKDIYVYTTDKRGCTEKIKCIKSNINLTNKKIEVKIMPETASQIAIDKLGDLGFTIELKEVGNSNNNNTKPFYELTGEKEGKFLGIFKNKMKITVQIDSETGEIIKTKKPWYAFLVNE